MANELKIRLSFEYSDPDTGATLKHNFGQIEIDVSGEEFSDTIRSIGTSEEAIILSGGDVATGGYCFIQNLDSTNFISLRQATSASDMVKVGAGEVACFRWDGDATAPYAIADTAACAVRIIRFDA